MYQGFNNRVAILPKMDLMLDLAGRRPWWEPTVGFLSLVLQDSS